MVAIALIQCGGILHLKLDIIQLPQLGFGVGIGDGFSRKIIACESAIRKGDRQLVECSPAATADIYSNPKSFVNLLLPPRGFGEGWGGVKNLRLI